MIVGMNRRLAAECSAGKLAVMVGDHLVHIALQPGAGILPGLSSASGSEGLMLRRRLLSLIAADKNTDSSAT